jgi:hypothetical protein
MRLTSPLRTARMMSPMSFTPTPHSRAISTPYRLPIIREPTPANDSNHATVHTSKSSIFMQKPARLVLVTENGSGDDAKQFEYELPESHGHKPVAMLDSEK